MGYALMWLESLTAALLLQALVTACTARWPRYVRGFASISVALAFLTLAVDVTWISSVYRFAGRMPSAPFPSVLTWTIGFVAGAVWILLGGLKRRNDDGTPAARNWPRLRLALVTAAALIVNGITFTNMDLAIKIHLAGIRAEAEGQVLALSPPPVSDRDNAAPVYLEAFAALTPSDKLPEVWREKEFDWLRLDKSQWKLSDKDVADYLASQEVGLALLRQAAAMPACSFDRSFAKSVDEFDDTTPASRWTPRRKLTHYAKLLALDAVVKASHGDAKGASMDIAAIHGITRHLDDPFLISLLRAAATEQAGAKALQEVLSLVHPQGEDLHRLEPSHGESYREKLPQAIRMSELVFGLSCFAMAAGESSNNWPAELGKEVDGEFKLIPREVWRVFFLQDDLSAYRRRMRELESLAAKPYYEFVDGMAAFNRSFYVDRGGLMTRLILPATGLCELRMTEADAARGLTRLALAATTYKNKTGHYPAQLEDLAPAYIRQIPMDPFDGKPLRMKQVADGLVLYSVGPEMKDHGGNYDDRTRTGDILFTLHSTPAQK